jgi:VCBS repeat-containing protein
MRSAHRFFARTLSSPSSHSQPRRSSRRRPTLEILEDRTVPSTFSQVVTVDGYAADTDDNGAFDTVNTTGTDVQSSLLPAFTQIGEQRGLLAFNLSGLNRATVITSASLSGNISLVQYDSTTNAVDVGFYGYASDGSLTTSDATASTNQVGLLTNVTTTGPFSVPISTQFMQSLVGTGSYAGFTLEIAKGERFFIDSLEKAGGTPASLQITYTINPAPTAVNDNYAINEDQPLTLTAAATTYLTMTSQPGDYIGQGRTYSFGAGSGTFTASRNYDNGVSLSYTSTGGSEWWYLDFAAPNNQTLTPGYYGGAARFPFQSANQPGLDVDGDGRGSNTLTGNFTVRQAIYDANGNVLNFDATFEQHSEGATPALFGEIQYNYAPGPAGVLLNDSDPNGNLLTANLVSGPSHGTLTLLPNGAFTYTPNANFNGVDSFTYKANDGTYDSNVATVTITVNPVNDPPTFTVGPNQQVVENPGPQTVPNWATNISPGPPDESNQTLAFLVSADKPYLFGAGPTIDPTTGTLTYTPAMNAYGVATVTVRLKDNGGTANGGQDTSAPQTFTITVNDPPAAVNDAFTVNENQTLTVSASGTTQLYLNSQPGDYIGGGQTVTYTLADGTFAASRDPYGYGGVAVNFNTPSYSHFWTLWFAAPNHVTLTPGYYGGATRYPFELASVPGMDIHGDGRGSNGLTGNFTIKQLYYDPAGNVLNFDATFEQHSEGAPPALLGEVQVNALSGLAGLLANDVDHVGNPLVALLVSGPAHGTLTLNSNGTFSYTPNQDFYGTDSFSYMANDGSLNSNVATVTITVNLVNHAPSFTKGSDQSISEGAGAQTVSGWATNISAGPSSESNQNLNFLVSADNPGLFAVQPAIDASGNLTYIPAAGALGSSTVTVRLHDDGGTTNGGQDTSAPQTFIITINNVAPALTTADQAANEGTAASIDLGSFSDPGTDGPWAVDVNWGDGSSDTVFSAAAPGALGGQSHTYADNGSYTVTVAVTDQNQGTGSSQFTVAVADVAPTPAITGPTDGFQGVSGQLRSFMLTATDPSQVDQAAGFTYQVDWGDNSTSDTYTGPSGTFAAHTFAVPGTYTVQVTATNKDGMAGGASGTVTILAAELQGANLVVGGTSGNDSIVFTPGANPGDWKVSIHGTARGTFHPTGSVQIYGEAGTDTVTLNGTANADTFVLDPGTVTVNGLAFGGSGIEKWTLNGQAGNDSFVVHVGAAATVNGGADSDSIVGPDVATTWNLTGPGVGKLAAVSFTAVESLTGGAANDTFHFTPAGSLAGIVDGGGGMNKLDYSSFGSGVTVNIQTATATATGGFAHIQSLVGSAAADILIGPNTTTTWQIKSANAGKVGSLSFSAVENLVGGSGTDTFQFSTGVGVSGTIDGGAGTNTLDYSAYTTGVTVDLTAGIAPGTAGVVNIQNVTGGSGNDSLTGNAADNILIGNAGNDTLSGGSGGNDILVGGAGNDQLTGGPGRSLLLGGSGSDVLTGGTNDDLLIAGTTSFDTKTQALLAILSEWKRTDLSYTQRIAHLRNGGGKNGGTVLNSTTVQDDGTPDTLTGGAGLDWFWANTAQDTLTDQTAGEQVN